MGLNYQGPIEGLSSCHDFGDIKIHCHRFNRESEHITLEDTKDGGIAITSRFGSGCTTLIRTVRRLFERNES